MIIIEIKLKESNRFKVISHKLHRKADNILFAVIQKLPEKLIPHSLMDWIGRYLDKQISDMNYQLIRSRWEDIELNKMVEKIHRQQAKK